MLDEYYSRLKSTYLNIPGIVFEGDDDGWDRKDEER